MEQLDARMLNVFDPTLPIAIVSATSKRQSEIKGRCLTLGNHSACSGEDRGPEPATLESHHEMFFFISLK
jgi:hypothetical protein